MATYSTFEELKVWQTSRLLNKDLYQLLMEKDDRKFGFLVNHIFKTAGSVMDNIAEGHGRQGTKEFILFLSYSSGSADELRSQLYRAMDLELITNTEFEKMRRHCVDIVSQLNYFSNYLKQTEHRGNKFKR
jgi:four helix bundle protein|tara:strand:- start:231 stop:623 length:393 start_codon:yes stop_codon:yes gene_type:complete